MTHTCNLHCHTIDPTKLDSLGIEDAGKWMPYIFDMNIVDGAKMTSDDPNLNTYGCTTIFTKTGDAYIIDTPYKEFFNLFKEYNKLMFNFYSLDDNSENNEDLEF